MNAPLVLRQPDAIDRAIAAMPSRVAETTKAMIDSLAARMLNRPDFIERAVYAYYPHIAPVMKPWGEMLADCRKRLEQLRGKVRVGEDVCHFEAQNLLAAEIALTRLMAKEAA